MALSEVNPSAGSKAVNFFFAMSGAFVGLRRLTVFLRLDMG
jgi:hypothetical protein